MAVTQIKSTGGTISVTPSKGMGVVDVEAVGTPITSLPNGVGFIAAADPVPFEHLANTTTYQITAAELLGLGAVKPAVYAVSVANISTLSGSVTVDSNSLTAGQLVLLTQQTTQRQNGPWIVQSGPWTRPAWYYSDATGGSAYTTYASMSQAYAGVTMQSLGGSLYGGTTWQLTTTGTITIDSSATAWSQVPVSSGVVSIPAGSSTDIQYNNSGSLAGTSNFTFTTSTNTLTVGGNSGSNGTISVGATGATSGGYSLNIDGGAGGSTSGVGGGVYVRGGVPANGSGGVVDLISGGGTGSNSGGSITVLAGGSPNGAGGSINCLCESAATGGSFNLTAGSASVGAGGGFSLTAGNTTGTSSTTVGGDINITGGSSQYGTGGSVLIGPGPGAPSPTNANDGITQFFTAENNALCIDQNGNTINGYLAGASAGAGGFGAYVDQGYYLPSTAPVTGGSFTIPPYTSAAIFNPGTSLSTQTFVFPTNPVDGQLLEISFTQAVTTPSWPSTVMGGPSTIAAFTGLSWRWIESLGKWVRRF